MTLVSFHLCPPRNITNFVYFIDQTELGNISSKPDENLQLFFSSIQNELFGFNIKPELNSTNNTIELNAKYVSIVSNKQNKIKVIYHHYTMEKYSNRNVVYTAIRGMNGDFVKFLTKKKK